MQRGNVSERIGQSVETTAHPHAPFQPAVTGATDKHEIIKLVGLFVMLVEAGHITKGAKGYQMVDIMLLTRRFGAATLGAAVAIACPHSSPLRLPVRAIVVDRIEPLPLPCQGNLQGRLQAKPVAARLV